MSTFSRKALKDGESGFLQGREMVTQQLAASSSTDTSALHAETISSAEILEYFGPAQRKEIAFSQAKQSKALVEQLLLQVLPQDQVTPEIISAAEAYCARVEKNQATNTNAQKLAQKRVTQKQAWACNMFCLIISPVQRETTRGFNFLGLSFGK